MRRREVIAGLAAASIARPGAVAEPSRRSYRVGLLSSGAPISTDSEQGVAFVRRLRQDGYVTGRSLELERRGARGQIEQLPPHRTIRNGRGFRAGLRPWHLALGRLREQLRM